MSTALQSSIKEVHTTLNRWTKRHFPVLIVLQHRHEKNLIGQYYHYGRIVIRKKIPENNGNIWVDTALTTIDHLVEKGNKVKKTLCVSHAYSTLLNPDHQPDLMI